MAEVNTSAETRVFTLRALLSGFAGGLFVAAFAYYNDFGIGQNLFVGNHVPLTIYSVFFLFVLFVNPVLRRCSERRWFAIAVSLALWGAAVALAVLAASSVPLAIFAALYFATLLGSRVLKINPLRPFSGGELVVSLSMVLVACSLPTSGLMRNLPQILVMPQQYGKSSTDWQKAEPDRYVTEINPDIFPQRDEADRVYGGYVQGLTKGKDIAPLRDASPRAWLAQGIRGSLNHLKEIPLEAWRGPARVWIPIVLVVFIMMLSLCRIAHKQWSENEQLAYPIAEFAHAFLKRDGKRTFTDIFYSPQFWIAFGCVLLIHLVNGWQRYESRMIQIPLSWNLYNIWASNFTFLHHATGMTYLLFSGHIYITIIAFAYFLPEEISLSLGLSLPMLILFTGTAYNVGHPINGDELSFMSFGAYVATAAVICYTGRHYYLAIFKRAIGIPAAGVDGDSAVAACRWFLAAIILLVLLFVNLGLDWLLSIMVVFVIGVTFLVLARASAETGIPFMGTAFWAKSLIVAFLGPAAIGPARLYLLELVTVATMQDNRECLAPYVINNLRLGSRNGVAPAPVSRAMLLTLAAGIFVAGIAFLWVVYSRGSTTDGYMGNAVPNGFASEIARDTQKLKRTGKLEESKTVTGLERLSSEVRDTNPSLLTFFLFGISLIAINSILRLRYVWWPLHPVAFLFWNVWATNNFIWSFLIGWLIKMLVVKIGGGRVYQNLKPLFIGLVVGDLCGGMIWIVFGLLYYFWTGERPHSYSIFPG